jgi:methylenetetrahydrofolate dehydrogenase (NADP+)/methenyltetrahydrofolate cyclohydrolase
MDLRPMIAKTLDRGDKPLTPKLIDGRTLAARLRTLLAKRVENLLARRGVRPALAVIRVGSDAASTLYVQKKVRACASVGIRSQCVELAADTDTEELVRVIRQFNANRDVHGILVQLPLPMGMDLHRVLESIAVEKDVDGFHLYNTGGLVVGGQVFPPCTPYGVIRLLEAEGVTVAGENVVIVGASNIVGKAIGLMLLQRGATVSICHANTRDLAQYTIIADILIVAAGRPRLIVPSMVRTGAVVIDVGINRLPDGTITGDVEFEGVAAKASRITPVPGGVGPMTVTMLLEHTILAAERA